MNHKTIRMRIIPVILSMLLLLMTVLSGCGNAPDDTRSSGSGAQTTAVTTRLSGEEEQSGDEVSTAGENQSNDKGLTGDEKLTDDAERSNDEVMNDDRDQSANEPSVGSGSADAADGDASGIIDEDGVYTSRDDVALYIYTYHKLPQNFITKKEAKKLGWTGGSLEEYAEGKCIGGDHFGNYEGLLPDDEDYYECDIDTLGKSKRGAKRIIYTDDGKVYYTDDHYESFVQLY